MFTLILENYLMAYATKLIQSHVSTFITLQLLKSKTIFPMLIFLF